MKNLFITQAKSKKPKVKSLLLSAYCLMPIAIMAQQQDSLVIKEQVIDEILITGVRATSQTPVTFSNVSKEELKSRNLGQDIPTLLGYLPSVVMTSDAGN